MKGNYGKSNTAMQHCKQYSIDFKPDQKAEREKQNSRMRVKEKHPFPSQKLIIAIC